MQSGCWCRNRSLYLGIDGLIGCLVALLRLAVEIRRDGQLADCIDDLGPSEAGIPFKLNLLARAMRSDAFCR